MGTFSELKTAGIQMFGDVGAWAYDEWKKLNAKFFESRNKLGPIYWVSVTDNKSLGCYSFSENIIYLHKGMVRPPYPTNIYKWCLENLNQQLTRDVLLHEMIHQMIHQNGGWEGETSHNNERFVGEVNRIAKLLELDVTAKVIKTAKTGRKPIPSDGPRCLTLVELSNFPYSVRPYEYYYGHK